MVIFLLARGTDWSTIPFLCLRFSDWHISIHNWVYIFHRVLSDPYFEECQTKKLLVCCKMFAFFKAIFKFCTAKRLCLLVVYNMLSTFWNIFLNAFCNTF